MPPQCTPTELGKLHGSYFQEKGIGLKELYLNDNKLHGAIPSQLGDMASLTVSEGNLYYIPTFQNGSASASRTV